jgi:1,4-dihydroxy-2-naphthoyl-CoA synthase
MKVNSKNYETVDLRKEHGIATVKFNRPDVLNALNNKMREELLKIIPELASDDNVRVIIFTGAGRRFPLEQILKSGEILLMEKSKEIEPLLQTLF